MGQKTLSVVSEQDAIRKIKSVEFYGNNQWVLLCKAWSDTEGWMKSTKAMPVPGGVVMQVTTQQQSSNGVYAVAEALTFIPGVTLDGINIVPICEPAKESPKLSLKVKDSNVKNNS